MFMILKETNESYKAFCEMEDASEEECNEATNIEKNFLNSIGLTYDADYEIQKL